MRSVFTWLKDEIISVVPAIIYFCIALNLIWFTEGLALRPDDVREYTYWEVTLAGLVMGKILIILNWLPFIDLFPNKPLVWNITWKFFVYFIFILLFRMLDQFIHLIFRYDNVDVVIHLIKVNLASPLFWSTQLWLALVFLGYIIFSEVVKVLGRAKVSRMIFG